MNDHSNRLRRVLDVCNHRRSVTMHTCHLDGGSGVVITTIHFQLQ